MENSSKKSAVVWTLIVVVALIIVAFGIYFSFFRNNSPQTPTTQNSTATSTLDVYSNSTYGFTFDYPSGWQLTESADKTSVTVDAGITANGLDAFTLVFTVVDNGAFQPVQTKVGNISYDATQNALVDTNETPERCLPFANLRGIAGGTGTLPSFNYAGSIMSDPAYWESAILTNKKYMLDVGESYERTTDDATNQIIQNGENQIYSSLSFRNGVKVRIPSCAPNDQ